MALPKPRIADVELVMKELNEFDNFIDMFSTLHDRSDGLRMDWYKTQSAKQPRTVGWKTGKSFEPKHLYFRTVDTGRMLPMHCAEFRTQFWAHKSF